MANSRPHVTAILALPLMVLAGCAPDQATAPLVSDDLLITAEAGKKMGQTEEYVFEPARWEQSRGTPTDIKYCQVNSFEDLDGNDFMSIAPDGVSYRVEKVNEKDGFVLIKQAPPGTATQQATVTHIGRAEWSAEFWWPSAVPTAGSPSSANTRAQGVVFPLRDASGAFYPGASDLLTWFGPKAGDSEPGAYEDDGTPVDTNNGVDLLNDPLGPIPINHPDPVAVHGVGHGGEPRGVALINQMLAEAEAAGRLTGVDCHGLVNHGVGVIHNEIEFTKTWPKQLKKLF